MSCFQGGLYNGRGGKFSTLKLFKMGSQVVNRLGASNWPPPVPEELFDACRERKNFSEKVVVAG